MTRVGIVRAICCVGAAVDLVAAAALASPAGSPLRQLAFPGADPDLLAYVDGTRTAFPLMLGWTVLLLWAAGRPVERRAVLLFTAVPVVVGLMVVELIDVGSGHATIDGTAPTLVLQAALTSAFVAAYRLAGSAAG